MERERVLGRERQIKGREECMQTDRQTGKLKSSLPSKQ